MDIVSQFSYITTITEGKRNPTRRQQTKDGKEKIPPGVDHVEDRASTPQSKEDRERFTGANAREPTCHYRKKESKNRKIGVSKTESWKGKIGVSNADVPHSVAPP